MCNILVLYYSMYGHVEEMAEYIAEGVEQVEGTSVTIKRVPELIPENEMKEMGLNEGHEYPVASPEEPADYDAVIFGTPTRFGNMASQMRNYLDQTGRLWMEGGLVGKVGSVFTSTGTGGGNETTIQSFHTTLMHHGMILVGLPYACDALTDISEVRGGSPLGAATIAGPDGKRRPSALERKMAVFQGRHVAQIAKKLKA